MPKFGNSFECLYKLVHFALANMIEFNMSLSSFFPKILISSTLLIPSKSKAINDRLDRLDRLDKSNSYFEVGQRISTSPIQPVQPIEPREDKKHRKKCS